MNNIKPYTAFLNEDRLDDFKKTLEFVFLDKKYKNNRSGIDTLNDVPVEAVGKTFFVENAVGYEYEVKVDDKDGKIRYRMIHPFHEKPLEESEVNEASKTVDLQNEREVQAKLNDQITKLKKEMAKLDVTNKKPAEKDKGKSKIVQQIGNLTVAIGQSMAKEAQLMATIAKTG